MMHSRAFLLLEKEYQELKEANLFGISVMPMEDNLMEWMAEIQGLKDSLWEGAELQLSLTYTEKYNECPPSVTFNTIPFHPNVDPQSGRPCVDFLDDPSMWNVKLTMSSILLTIQVMLSNPTLNNAVNPEAAKLLQTNVALYRQRVIQCVKTSQHLEAILSTVEEQASTIKFYIPPEESAPSLGRKMAAISYEDYYLEWSTIATSNTAEHFKTPVFEDPNFITNYYGWMAKNVAEEDEWDENIHRHFISEFIAKQKEQEFLETQEFTKLIPSTTPESQSDEHEASQEEEPWEKEVEDLVVWSNSLDQARWN